jgi:tRNA (mo5U34)-methyltransferase
MSSAEENDSAFGEELRNIRDAVRRTHGVDELPEIDVARSDLVRFSPLVQDTLEPEREAELTARAKELQPWLQGPFLIGGNLVVGGTWRVDERWRNLEGRVPDDLSGKRVLDVGSNAGYDSFMFKLRGAEYVLACEPFAFHEQALFLESVYQTGVDFQRIGWQLLDPAEHGLFDLIHCHGVLYHEPMPMMLLEKMRAMLAPGGTMLFGSMMLAEPELAEFSRFVPGAYSGDPTWWWVPGRLAMRWMLEAAGFVTEETFGFGDGPPGEFPTINGYFRLSAGEPDPLLTPPF